MQAGDSLGEIESTLGARSGRKARVVKQLRVKPQVLKTGCCVEALRLASMPRIERALASFIAVSWRIAHLMRIGRTCPDLPAELRFDDDEIKAAYVLNEKPPPAGPPRLNEVIRHMAMLNGFPARKGGR